MRGVMARRTAAGADGPGSRYGPNEITQAHEDAVMASIPEPAPTGDTSKRNWLESHEAGYHKTLGNRQVQMIAIGGAIGTGLFLGAGARLQAAGPSLAIV